MNNSNDYNNKNYSINNDNNNNKCAHFGIIWQFGLNDLIGSYELTFLNNNNNPPLDYYLGVVGRLAYLNDPESYTGRSLGSW